MGPNDYVSPHARELSGTNRCFIVVTRKQYFLMSLSGESFGPYDFIDDDPTGRIFKCSRPVGHRLYDLYYDDGHRLAPIGTTSLIVNTEELHSSADGKHYGVFVGGLITDPEYVYYDGYMLPINHGVGVGVWDIGLGVRTFSWTDYAINPRLRLYSSGLIPPRDNLMRFSLYHLT